MTEVIADSLPENTESATELLPQNVSLLATESVPATEFLASSEPLPAADQSTPPASAPTSGDFGDGANGGGTTASPTPAGPPPKPSGRAKGGTVALALIGLMLLLVAGVAAITRYTNWLGGFAVAGFYVGACLIAIGAGLVVLGLAGRRVGAFIAATTVLTLLGLPVVAGAEAMAGARWSWSIGEAEFAPTDRAQAEEGFSMGIGDLVVDLTDPSLTREDDLTVDVSLGIGETTLIVPADRPVVVNATMTTGAIEADELDSEDWSLDWDIDAAKLSVIWDNPDFGGRYWSRWDPDGREISDGGRSAGGLKVALTATSRAEPDSHPLLTVNCRGSIGSLQITEHA
jgi:hypothetical protein